MTAAVNSVFARHVSAGAALLVLSLVSTLNAQAQTETTISTDGIVESKAGGFRFPDGTVQDTKDSGDTLFELDCLNGELAVWNDDPGTLAWGCALPPEGPQGEATGDRSGYSVAMSGDGNTVVIGAPLNDGTGSDAGHARIYTLGCAAP